MEKASLSLAPRLSRTCNECKARKVRCIVQQGQSTCNSCLKRRASCRFSHTKRLVRNPYGATDAPEPEVRRDEREPSGVRPTRVVNHSRSETWSASPPPENEVRDELYIDLLLESPGTGGLNVADDSMFRRHEDYITSSNLAIFSESRVRLLSQRLGHNRVRDLVERVAAALDVKHHSRNDLLGNPPLNIISQAFKQVGQPSQHETHLADACIRSFFENVHPQYPFLDRAKFEGRASDPSLSEYLSSNPAFSALYHAVLALGCQYTHDKTLDPVNVESWRFASVSLGLLPLVLLPRETLVNLQAITAMAIYALNVACITIAETLVLEAARMAQAMGYHRVVSRSDPAVLGGLENECYKTFWVVYMIERQTCFLIGRSPSIADYDVGCPVPPSPESRIEGLDWFVTMLRLGRLCGKAYEKLFSSSSTMNSPRQYMEAMTRIRTDLRRWEAQIPAAYLPGKRRSCHPMPAPAVVNMLLRLDYMYYWLVMALCRLELYVGPAAGMSEVTLGETTRELMAAARNAIQLTKDIDIRPYIAMWVRGTVPLAALFILFDLVVHNPCHPETELNLSLLDVAAGYFGRLDYATNGAVPAALLSGFAHIANQFVKEVKDRNHTPTQRLTSDPGTSPDSLPDDSRRMQGTDLTSTIDYSGPAGSAPFDKPLSYPTLSLGDVEGMMTDNLLAGFDFTDMFGYAVPEAIYPSTSLRNYVPSEQLS